MPVVEIFLSAFIKVLFDKLASSELLDFARLAGIPHSQLKDWSGMLLKIQAVLIAAEEKQIKDKAVELWLEDLQDLAYDLDDILDEFATEALRHKLTMEPPQPSSSKVRALLPSCCTSFSPRTLIFNSRMRSNIEEISTRLQLIIKQRNELGLEKVSGGTSTSTWQRQPTTSLIHEPCIYGRDEDKRQILEFLLRDESGDNKFGVIPIVGMGGVGKTTLAQMVYNDEMVDKHFDLKAWVYVSDEFDIMRITKTILESVPSSTKDFEGLDQAQVELKKSLVGKKFLIVLDDVWKMKYNDWNVLKSPFNDGALGSKFIVTTREHRDVALMMGTVQHRVLQLLSDDDCWSVFAQHAFGNRSIDANPNLVSIGRKIVKKCRGLPLAARTLGGLLRCKEGDDEWEDVLNSEIWDLPYQVEIVPALRLSYHHLPPHLKRCFAYCSILPKDYEFEETELVLLWMAEGFIQPPKGTKLMEDIGRDYFREFLSRSFFQPSSKGGNSKFVMHDLINDLALLVARDTCFRLEDLLKDQDQYKYLQKARHSSYMRGRFDGKKKFEIFEEAKHLRTFLPFSLGHRAIFSLSLVQIAQFGDYLTSNVPLNLLPKLRCSRVLSLSEYNNVSELPDSIGDLKHLRYLNLSYTDIRRLPESVARLYNLQTLMLRGCSYLKKLPKDMGNLINLRHLDITYANSLKEMPAGIGKLASLQTLSNYIVVKDNGFRIRELGNLIHLGGTLCISGLQNVVDPMDASGARLKDKQGLGVLFLIWSASLHGSQSERVETEVLDMLRPHEKLKELYIESYKGTKFSPWIGDPLFSNMVCMSLENCKNCTSLPALGQLPSLKDLYIEGMSAVKSVGCEFYGQGSAKPPFPLLETLRFENMPEWEDWSTFGVDKQQVQPFTRVSKLSIRKCPKLLGKLPSDLPCLKTLEIGKCPQLQMEVSSLVLPSLTSIKLNDVPPPSLPMLLETSNTLQPSSLITSIDMEDVSIPDSLCNLSVADELKLANVMFKHVSSVTSMRIKNIERLAFLPKWITQGAMGLEGLKIDGCKELTTLWKNEVRLQQCLPACRSLAINNCDQLVSLFEEEEEDDEGEQHEEGLPPCTARLEYLEIEKCEKLEKLPRGLHSTLACLVELRILRCPSLTCFPETGLPSTLRRLSIGSCKGLQRMMMNDTNNNNNNNLEELTVHDCPSLTYLISSCRGRGRLPPTLKRLNISTCEKLEALLEEEEGTKINCPSLEYILIWYCRSLKYLPDARQPLGNLSELVIEGCGNLESLPEGWFQTLHTSNLSVLSITDCEKLETFLLPHRCNNNLTSLRQREIGGCPVGGGGGGGGIVSYFLEERGNFLTNLVSLSITYDMKFPSEWGWHRFSSLKTLRLQGPISRVVAEDGREDDGMLPLLLPNSLTKLQIGKFQNLETLPFKEFQNLASLQTLEIYDCPRLASFPEEGLPPSLLELRIDRCPKLKKRCEKGKGPYWRIIAHIPKVHLW